MIIDEPKIWDNLIEDNSKVSKFRKKAFPLFNSLESLYEGNAFFFFLFTIMDTDAIVSLVQKFSYFVLYC
ncbi:hypothetical protein BAE44_0009652 [Dichanthelium oligosanthes]|uniref:Uncharacterized protein n=1 Tax=Dichanthelium oligosanthes TaxID=888268 RepID=A0A1E5VW46_9POAL|nr:hypothetical protein BAE44_0009652 [Dichanthelium oligosanthes]